MLVLAPAATAFAQDIQVTKTRIGPEEVQVGDQLTYTITVANNHPTVQAFSVTMTDTLPAEESFVSISPSTNCVGTSTITCTEGILFPGTPVTYTLTVDLVAGDPGTTVTNTATVDRLPSVEAPPDLVANNTSSAFARIAGPDATVQKSHVGNAVRGQQVTYNVVVTNIGGAATVGTTTLTDTLPAGLTAVSITGGAGWTCALGPPMACDFAGVIAAGNGTPPITVVATVDANAPNSVTNSATVTTPADGDATNDTASDQTAVVSSADVSVTKTGPAVINAGDPITYNIDVANAGPSAAATVSLTDALPADITFVSLTSPAGWTCTTPAVGANGTITCTLPTLGAGGAAQPFTLVGQVDGAATGNITNPATVASATTDPDAANNTDSTTAAVTTLAADLSVTKTAAPTANVGDDLTYTIDIANAGPDGATALVLTDPLPTGITFVSLTTPAGWTCTTPAVGANGTVTCNLAALASGAASGPLMITGTVTAAAAGTTTNTATIAGAEADATPANNSASFSTDIIGAPPPTTLSLALTFSSPTYYATGQIIGVSYLVTNTSAVTVSAIAVTDPKVPVITCPAITLAGGAAMTCTGPYTITDGDLTAGLSPFTATVTGSGGATATATGAITLITFEIGKDFVETRAKLLNPDPPGLHDRIGSANAALGESNGDAILSFSGSVLAGAGEAAESLASGTVELPVRLWIDGKLTLHSRDNGGGGFALVGLGGDYLVNEDLLLGAALYIDWMSDTTSEGRFEGRGYLVGPYVSAALGEHWSFNGAIFYGGSSNDAAVTLMGVPLTGTFTTQRWLARAKLDGQFGLAHLVIRPDATLYMLSETAGDYTVRDSLGNPVNIAGFTTTNLNLSGGTVIERPIELENGLTFIPRVGFRFGATGSGPGLALNDPYGRASVGFILEGDQWKLDSSIEGSLWASSLKALSYKAALSGQF